MITIFQKSIVEAEMYGVESNNIDESQTVIDNEIDDYTAHIVDLLVSAGHDVEVRYNDRNAKCYHTDTDEEWDSIRDLPGFWEWYN